MRSNTIETLGHTRSYPTDPGSATIGRLILDGERSSKWMTKQASAEYLKAVQSGWQVAKDELLKDPHTRRAVIHGPVGACWISTQVISDPSTPGAYKVFAMYRSMDKDHVQDDLDIQSAIAHLLVDRVSSVTLFITCFHEYI